MKKMITLILALVLVVSLTPAVSAGKNPDTGAKVEPVNSWYGYIDYHRYVPLGREITIKLYFDAGNKDWCTPTWKLYKTNLTGKESPEELAKTGESLVRNKKSAIDSYGSGVYNFPVTIHVDETFEADELGVGTYLMVGYMAYENQKDHSVTNDYKTLCAIAIHVVEKEKPIESIRYYECKEDGTVIRELTSGDELKTYICMSSNDNNPTYIKAVPSPADATEFVYDMYAMDVGKPGEHYLTYDNPWAEDMFRVAGETCGTGRMNVTIRDYADDPGSRTIENLFSVTVPHERNGEVKTLIRPNCTEEGLRGAWCWGRSEGCDYVFDKKILAPYGHGLQERGKEIVTEPTATKPGLAVGICDACGVSGVEQPIPAIFSDVLPDDFYSDALDYGYDAGWVSGTSATEFSPNEACLRSQVVTFLWRAAGEPKAKTAVNPFVDVKPGDYYYDAVLWAVENGITTGADDTHFEPNGICNRSQVVTFLYRAFEKPPVDSAENPFTDVSAGDWYADAVLWAVQEGITNGLSATKFGPNEVCNRSQVVTFLYRTYVN